MSLDRMLALVRKGCMSANGGDFSFSLHRDTPVRSNGGSYRFRWSRLRPRRIVQALATGRTAIGHGTARRQRVLEFGLPPLISRWLTGKSGRGRGARFEETAGSLKIRKQTSTLQTSSGRSGSTTEIRKSCKPSSFSDKFVESWMTGVAEHEPAALKNRLSLGRPDSRLSACKPPRAAPARPRSRTDAQMKREPLDRTAGLPRCRTGGG